MPISRYNPADAGLHENLSSFYCGLSDPSDRAAVVAQLMENCRRELQNSEPLLANMWLQEYELYQGRDAWAKEMETQLELRYRIRFVHMGTSLFSAGKDKNQLLNLSMFKDKFKGERAFILGNGPSLNMLDLSRLRNDCIFGVNGIFLKFAELDFEPTFYVVEDTLVAEDREIPIGLQSGSVKIFGNCLKKWQALDCETIFTNVVMDFRSYPGFPHFSVDADTRIWVGGTVSYLNLQLAYYFGFSDVYLIGFDHSYTVPEQSLIDGRTITSTTDDPNHFHPDYFGKGFRWHDPMVERMEKCYLKARHAYSLANRRIRNATPGGHLEIFERISFDEALATGRPAEVEGEPGVSWVANIRKAAFDELREKRQHCLRKKPLLSVVIPVCGRDALLHKTISSAVNQNFDYVETIVVVDRSSPAAEKITEKFSREDPRLKLIFVTDRDFSASRAAGIAAATGDYVFLLNPGEWLRNDAASILKQAIDKYDADVISCGMWRRHNGTVITDQQYLNEFTSGKRAFRQILHAGPQDPVFGMCVRKELAQTRTTPTILEEFYLLTEKTALVREHIFHAPVSPSIPLNEEDVSRLFAVFDSRLKFLDQNKSLLTEYEKDYYIGLWRFIVELAGFFEDSENADPDGTLGRSVIRNIISRQLSGKTLLADIKSNRTRQRLKRALGEFLFPGYCDE